MSILNRINTSNNLLGSEIEFNRKPDRTDQLNSRINNRNIPDAALKPNFDPRPVSTKYALFPLIDRKTAPTVEKKEYNKYSLETNFNPGNDKAPVDGFVNNISVETELRGQNYKMTGGDLGNKYIPSTSGSLYNVSVGNLLDVPDSKHKLLFERTVLSQAPHDNLHPRIGGDTFHNNTRVQLRDT